MPKIQHTVIRGRNYYMRIRIPADLVKTMGGQTSIMKTLKTSDPWEAKKRLNHELAHIHAKFDELRRTNKQGKSKTPLSSLSDSEVVSMVLKWMAQREEASRNYDPKDIPDEEIAANLLDEQIMLGAELKAREFESGSRIAQSLLDKNQISYEDNPNEFFRLAETLTRAEFELVTRAIQYHGGEPVIGTGDKFFSSFNADAFAANSHLGRKKITFGELCGIYTKDREGHVGDRGIRGIKEEIEVLKNFISAESYIHEIDNEKCREVFEWIRQLPRHASKVYPNMPIRKAIELSNKENGRKIGVKRINTFMMRLRAIFSLALDEGYLPTNPVSKKLIVSDKRLQRDLRNPFSIDQLQKIFMAPLYTGCVDDEFGYGKVGPKIIRRARFWVPLIALWTGMRLEEICQLDLADIRNQEGIDIIEVYPSDDKRVKSENAIRIIPIHDELKKVGFLQYVEEMRNKGHTKLFPELKKASVGNYSINISKWFARFLDKLEMQDPKLCFHSFRHNFRDALREAELPGELVRSLGGWAGNSVVDNYGRGTKASQLNKYHSRIGYPGLNLSHLYSSKAN